jgi:hypothetical protein
MPVLDDESAIPGNIRVVVMLKQIMKAGKTNWQILDLTSIR